MIRTRLTEAFDLQHPILGAPMALVSGGALAAAVTGAGGLGFIGGAYCDRDWVMHEMEQAGNAAVGVGFISWKLRENRDLLSAVLERNPRAVFLSFADPAEFAGEIAAADVPMICQVQSLRDAQRAAECGALVIVAQGAEAGGHGESRATMTLVPEVADWLAGSGSEAILVAAGGIADGRGLAAALALGAEGVLVGSRLWASTESLAHPNMVAAAIDATGDQTIRSSVMDIARRLEWPGRYTARVLRNGFTDRWHGDLPGLLAVAEEEAARWGQAWATGDVEVANTFVGEAAGLIHDRVPVAEIVTGMVAEAEAVIARNAGLVG
ncbi:MAG: oxidoreductase [Rhodobacterales bacterium]|nr:MAG: oxidoreductase [Rhodobacterales bacterium]